MKIRRTLGMKIIMILAYLVLTVSGLVLMKLGNNSGQIAVEGGTFNFNISLISAAGFLCYLCSFLLFTKLVLMFDLSYIMPLSAGAVQVLSLIASKVVFKENLSVQAILGAAVVIAGILIMNWKR